MAFGIVTADVPVKDDCPVLTRIKAYVTQLGIVPTLEHVVRDRRGVPMNLTELFPQDSESVSQPGDTPLPLLRSKEIISAAGPCNPVKQVTGRVVHAAGGVLQFDLTAEQVRRAGIYQLSIAVSDQQNRTVVVENPIMWVEPSLFTLDRTDHFFVQGPPSVQELRQAIMDSGAAENLLLDDVEFSDDQLAAAVCRPIRTWNSQPPPIRPPMDTRTFPFHEEWLQAICGHLFVTAAHNYRRNHLPYNAGGVAIDDRNKEQPYLTMGEKLLDDWNKFVQYKKVEINMTSIAGTVGSIYGGLFH